MDLLIVADDFTGACDAAAPFGSSRSTVVALAHEAPPDAEVVAIDLDLRECASDYDASVVVERAVRSLSAQRIYLKVDSTLRGPVAGMLRGALSGSDKPVAVIAPAFPEQRRLYAGGHVVVGDEVGASLLEMVGYERTALLAATFARTADEVERAVEHARMRGAVRVIVDTDEPRCLASVAEAWHAHPEWLLVGSGGLSRHVASGVVERPLLDLGVGPLVVVAGSPTTVTAAQLDRLPNGSDVIVLKTVPSAERDAGEVSLALADDVARLAASVMPRAVVLAGGATARVVCHRLGVRGVRLFGELAPGIPIGELEGGVWDGVTVVTKAGGFGGPTALLDVARALGVSMETE